MGTYNTAQQAWTWSRLTYYLALRSNYQNSPARIAVLDSILHQLRYDGRIDCQQTRMRLLMAR